MISREGGLTYEGVQCTWRSSVTISVILHYDGQNSHTVFVVSLTVEGKVSTSLQRVLRGPMIVEGKVNISLHRVPKGPLIVKGKVSTSLHRVPKEPLIVDGKVSTSLHTVP